MRSVRPSPVKSPARTCKLIKALFPRFPGTQFAISSKKSKQIYINNINQNNTNKYNKKSEGKKEKGVDGRREYMLMGSRCTLGKFQCWECSTVSTSCQSTHKNNS